MFQNIRLPTCFFTILCCSFFLVSCASKEKSLNASVEKTAKNLILLYKDSNRPWPTYNLMDYPILFVSFKEKVAKRLIRNELQSLEWSQWKNKIPKTKIGFDTQKIDDQQYLILHLDNYSNPSPEDLMTVIVHEGFHVFFQQEWKKQKNAEGRGDIYPLQAIPRYYRWEMKKNLVNHLHFKDPKSLQKYSYWFYKWKNNFKEEYENYTDRFEGTAQFYTNDMMTLFYNNHSSSKLEPYEFFRKKSETSPSFQQRFSLSHESYVLGTLTGILLNQGGTNWQQSVRLGSSPMELLAQRFKPLRDKVDNAAQTEFLRASIREMHKIDADGKLDKIISDLANPKVLKVVVPSAGLQFSSFSTQGVYRSFFDFPGIKEVQMIELASPHTFSSPSFEFSFQPGEHWVTAKKTPCSNDHATLLLSNLKIINLSNTSLRFNNVSKNGVFHGRLKTENGTQWFCVAPK